jgi:phosphoribosylanthranilate isomerase
MVRIKICGITRLEDARLAVSLGADALGFNFYEKSSRCLSPSDAWNILRKLPALVSTVGVFVNWDDSSILALAKSFTPQRRPTSRRRIRSYRRALRQILSRHQGVSHWP